MKKKGNAGSDLQFALSITAVILLLQLAGWFLSNSLSLLSDTGHVFSDLLALTVSFAALKLSAMPPTPRRTFGFHRVEVFSALFNALLLFAMALLIAWEALQRLAAPPVVAPAPMLVAAVMGLVGNLLVARRLELNENLNIKSAFMHAVGDALSSVGVVIGALLIMVTGMVVFDLIISFLIAAIITASSYRLARASLSILFESAPRTATPEMISTAIMNFPGVRDVHDVHVWSISSDIHYATAHIVTANLRISETKRLINVINKKLNKKFGIAHTTFQMECGEKVCRRKH